MEFATIVEEMLPVRMKFACSAGGEGSTRLITSDSNERAAANIAAAYSWLESGSLTITIDSSFLSLHSFSMRWKSGTSWALR